MLVVSNLSIGYPGRSMHVTARNINAELEASRLTCLVGNNGSGKSTFIRTLAGLQKPLSGSVSFKASSGVVEVPSLDSRTLSKYIGVVLTERAVFDNLTVFDVVSMGRTPYNGIFGTLSSDDLSIVDRALTLTRIEGLKYRYVNELSDGEMQKVMIAKAIAQQTPVILLDEPSAYLDYKSKMELMCLLSRLAHEEGKSILVSSHDLDIVRKTADIFWIMENGSLRVSNELTL